ncbi:hypothetical protein AAC387_Pa04g0841 [Persea americana]
MASSFYLRISPSFPSIRSFNGVRFSPPPKKISLNLSSSSQITSGFRPMLPIKLSPIITPLQNPPSLTVFAKKGYKMKSHKASAKRFRVTGSGRIMRRRSGKQHLLVKKNTKRKLRLSKMIEVKDSDRGHITRCLPYLKANRTGTPRKEIGESISELLESIRKVSQIS